jgi:hypothetical protein
MARWRQVGRFVERVFYPLRKSRRKTIAALTDGLLHKQQLGLASIARGMDDDTTVKHRVKRIGRFATNEGISPWEVSQCLMDAMLCDDRRNLIAVDWTDLGEYMMLKATLYFQRRGLPLAWCCVRKWEFEKSQNAVEERFILELARCIGPEREWVLVADRGFRRVELLRRLTEEGIRFVIRLKDDVWVAHEAFTGLLADLPHKPGKRAFYKNALLHKTRRLRVNLVVTHQEPAAEPWYLATNLDEPPLHIERLYAKRMSIEQEIRDAKSGLGLKGLWLSEPERMERMMILMAIAFLLIALTAAACQQRGEDPQVTTSKRKARPASYFTIGCRLLELYPDRLCTDLEVLHAA